MATIQDGLTTFRQSTGKEPDHQGWLKQLKINNKLYQIKDPAVEQLASLVDTAITGVQSQIKEASKFEEVSKAAGAAKYAGSVTQDATGKITVTYTGVRDAALDNTAAATKTISSLTQDVNGVVSYTATDLIASNVGSTAVDESTTSIAVGATNVQGAIEALATGVQTAKAEAIAAAEAKVNALAGTDWTAAAGTVKDIIDELSGADTTATQAMITVADKLRGDFTYGTGNQTTDVKSYVDGEITRLSGLVSAVSVTAEGDALVNASVDEHGRVVTVGAQGALNDAVGYAKSALQTVTGESGTNALISVSKKSGNDGAKTSAVSATSKLTNAVAAAETALQSVSAGTGETLIDVSTSNKAVTVTSTSALQTAVNKATAALPANKVQKSQITYIQSGAYDEETGTLTFTSVTDKDIVTPNLTNWPNT